MPHGDLQQFMDCTADDPIHISRDGSAVVHGTTNVTAILAQVASALHMCHSNDICYGDIKADNIVLGPWNKHQLKTVAKLTDFGLSKTSTSKTSGMSCMVGTVPYMAPEIVQYPIIDHGYAVDLWAFGVLMYRLLSHGRFPYTGIRLRSPVDEVKKVFGHMPAFSHLPENVAEIIYRLLAFDPDQRMDIVDVCAHPMFSRYLD